MAQGKKTALGKSSSERESFMSKPPGKDEGSRSNAQYRGNGQGLVPDAWGTEAQWTHDNTRMSAGRQCRA